MIDTTTTERQWAWFDRWTNRIIDAPGYPPIWDEMKTERFKPTIVWTDDVRQGEGR